MSKMDKAFVFIEIIIATFVFIKALIEDSWILGLCTIFSLGSALVIYLTSQISWIEQCMIDREKDYQDFLRSFRDICQGTVDSINKNKESSTEE